MGFGHIGALTNPCSGAEDAEPGFPYTGGPPLPRKRVLLQKSFSIVYAKFEDSYTWDVKFDLINISTV